MANLLRTEWYKLWHSWYFWGIGIFTFLLSSILLLDSKGKTSNLVMASLYNTPLLYFLIIVFIALFIGNDLGGRTLNAYLTAGHKRGYVFWAKVMVSQIGCILILTVPLLTHEIIGRFGMKERSRYLTEANKRLLLLHYKKIPHHLPYQTFQIL
jgi:ABC-2 type transport system permease protein